jgi:hypothetical protein
MISDEDEIEDENEELDPEKDLPEEIICDAKNDSLGPLVIAFIIFVMSFSFGNLGALPYIFTEEFTWFSALILILPAAFFVCIIFAVYYHLRWKKFGLSRIKLHDRCGKVGGLLKGTLITSVEINPSADFEFRLSCTETKRVKTKKGHDTQVKKIWSETKKVRSQGYRSRTGIPFEFSVPSNCRGSNEAPEGTNYKWEVAVRAPGKGLNFGTSFKVFVLKDLKQPAR